MEFHPAFVLHYHAYRESSLLLQLLTIDHGLTSVMARGARKAKSPLKGLLQPFTPLQVSWYGRNELKTLRQADNDGKPYLLSAMPLWCGLYVNELLVKLLRRHDSSPTIFTLYQQTLAQLLQQDNNPAITLRLFEKQLLQELGYALPFHHDNDSASAIKPDDDYIFQPELGFKLATNLPGNRGLRFSGKILLDIKRDLLHDRQVLAAAKQLFQLALQPLLGYQPLQTRTFLTMQHNAKKSIHEHVDKSR